MNERELQERTEAQRRRAVAESVQADFSARQKERKLLERGWQLNMNFVSGNQYCDVSPAGELEEEGNEFFWQTRRCFNHIAPTVETRLARLAKIRPSLGVRAFSDSEADTKTARLCSNILKSMKERIDLDKIIARATLWSETCGTAFYKVVWDGSEGNEIGLDGEGNPVREGDVSVIALSPFEIYPDSLTAEDMTEVRSLIHAKAVPVSQIREKFGVEVAGRCVEQFAPFAQAGGWKNYAGGDERPVIEDAEILIERYTRPCREYPAGRLEIVAGDTLLYEGELPYRNGNKGERIFPFVRQTCLSLAGSFFGTSVVDRMIPLQRAYNAVRNRKHEFLNRLSMGVIAVEDGSVDAEALAEDGLQPGKVLVYRQGSTAPAFLDFGAFPAEFAQEEERISNEFILVSGTSEVSRNSTNPTRVTSATGLQLLIEQDNTRMQMSAESVERAVKDVGRQVLHLYKQFASAQRVLRMTGTGGHTELFWFSASDISADDVQFETGYDRSPDQVREDILYLLSLGLLQNEKGEFSDDTRGRVLEALGFGSFENARDLSRLHLQKAARENTELAQRDVEAEPYDDHGLHIAEHTRFLLSGGENDEATKARIMRHLTSHRRKGD